MTHAEMFFSIAGLVFGAGVIGWIVSLIRDNLRTTQNVSDIKKIKKSNAEIYTKVLELCTACPIRIITCDKNWVNNEKQHAEFYKKLAELELLMAKHENEILIKLDAKMHTAFGEAMREVMKEFGK